ncbi:MAG: oxidoreductase, partial [Candidatus Acidiferrum sp.]
MKLSERQMRALGEICETFAPGQDGWPSAAEIGVARAIADALPDPEITGRPEELLQLLDIWNSRWHGLLAIGRREAFSAMPAEERIRLLLSWADSSLAVRRGAFQALRKAIGYFYVMLPGAGGGEQSRDGASQRAANPVWAKFGYPGPLGVQRPEAARPLRVAVPERDFELSADVCVVGSGAGGGTAAAVLAAAGKDVIVLEAGGYYDDADFDGAELKG